FGLHALIAAQARKPLVQAFQSCIDIVGLGEIAGLVQPPPVTAVTERAGDQQQDQQPGPDGPATRRWDWRSAGHGRCTLEGVVNATGQARGWRQAISWAAASIMSDGRALRACTQGANPASRARMARRSLAATTGNSRRRASTSAGIVATIRPKASPLDTASTAGASSVRTAASERAGGMTATR